MARQTGHETLCSAVAQRNKVELSEQIFDLSGAKIGLTRYKGKKLMIKFISAMQSSAYERIRW